ncbi:unknown [Parabacteroides merdae CAG:48]|nr:unknown [Parabacteroides merdae CAG:48]
MFFIQIWFSQIQYRLTIHRFKSINQLLRRTCSTFECSVHITTNIANMPHKNASCTMLPNCFFITRFS